MALATRLFLLIVLGSLPIFAIVVAQEVQLRAARRTEVIQQTGTAADLVAARQARVSTSAQTLLARLANTLPWRLSPAMRLRRQTGSSVRPECA